MILPTTTDRATPQTDRPRQTKKALWRLRRDQSGAASAEIVVAIPLLLVLIMLIAQFTLWAHATHIAQAAAAQALAATRVLHGSASAGTARAHQVLQAIGTGPLRSHRISAHRGTGQATVSISGIATPVVPFLRLPVHAEAAGPVERITTGT
ncbi:pilus assembly protein [Crossiella sp. SN42]|uniref:TadE/TadG family type IV pilus assembly protein n=1 Tax=Crossiella sp. SN42 TaxID=2944808 RepID=UPI00207C6A9D|nr:TadE/TadG family type IV pilus assembly protein [Crossiella sp. SN42]MCO1575882.1 pilus assembly protein [Crossiella sp. SN42]